MRAVKTVSTKFNADRGGYLMECDMAPQVYNRMVQQLGSGTPETDVFASWVFGGVQGIGTRGTLLGQSIGD